MLSFSSLPHESKSNLSGSKTRKMVINMKITGKIQGEKCMNSLCVDSTVDGVHTRRKGECGKAVYFLFIGFCLKVRR